MTFLKLFGMLTMLADHTGFLFDIQWLRIIGRACFPVFAFMTAYGWSKTRDRWNYVSRMMQLALFSEVPFLWMYELSGGINVSDANTQFALICSMISAGLLLWGGYLLKKKIPPRLGGMSIGDTALVAMYLVMPVIVPHTNVLYTLTTALLFLWAIQTKYADILMKVILGAGLLLGYGIFCDYSIFGVMLIIGIALTQPEFRMSLAGYQMKIKQAAAGLVMFMPYVVMLIWAVVMTIFYDNKAEFVGMLVGIGVVFWYDMISKQKPAPVFVRKFCYVFYPVHLLILDIAAVVILHWYI